MRPIPRQPKIFGYRRDPVFPQLWRIAVDARDWHCEIFLYA
jgi:hypothetical protein